MKCVEIIGGLANQMFGYVFARSLGKHTFIYQDVEGHNGYELERVFGIKISFSNKLVVRFYKYLEKKHLFFKRIIEKQEFEYDETVYKVKSSRIKYYVGYWQNECYLLRNEKEIRRIFSFNERKYLSKTADLANILKGKKSSVSLHIRRGDYYSNPNALIVHGNICDIGYYDRAISRMKSLVPNAEFYVFSDDHQWVADNFKLLQDAVYVDWNRKEDSWQDMALMSCCSHHIIANSSFSWFGAWLATPSDNKVVIAPNRWLNTIETTGIIPDRWIKV